MMTRLFVRYAFATIIGASCAVILGVALRSVAAAIAGYLAGVFVGVHLARLMFPENRRG